MARLFVLSGASIGTTFDIDGTSVLGRGDDADVAIRESSVSRKHARLVPQPEPGVWKVVDLGSSNGIHVGGRRVQDALVRDGGTFTLGDVEIRLRDETGAAAASAGDSAGASGVSAEDAGGLELEFGDDIDLELSRVQDPRPTESGRSGASRSGADRVGARATQQRAARRAAAVGSGPPAAAPSRPGAGDLGRPVLQYGAQGRGRDINQLPGWVRTVLVVAALALALGVAYGAFTLTRTARSQTSALSE